MTTTWSNWARGQHCTPLRIERPTSEAEVVAIVRAAATQGHTVRAVGAGHSFTDAACTDGVMLDLVGMQQILHVDPTSGRVTVQGGARLHALGPQLAEHGWALANQGDIDRQSITGAIATATHGTGIAFPNLSAQIVGLRLVTGSGDILELSEESDREAYLAARVSFGALGIITAVTIQCVPLYTLHRHDELIALVDVLERLDEHVEGNDHFEFFVFPYADRAITRRTRRSTEAPVPTPEWKRTARDRFENLGLGTLCRLGRRFPRLAPRINRVVTSIGAAVDLEDHAYRVYANSREVRFTEMEYALPREHARAAVEAVIGLVREQRLPILFPLEVRFAAGDDAFLSTAHGRETCYVAVHQFEGMDHEVFFRQVEAIMDSFGGRPHWGKRHFQDSATLAVRYPDWARFQTVRARLDPAGTFRNAYTDQVLGPIPTAAT